MTELAYPEIDSAPLTIATTPAPRRTAQTLVGNLREAALARFDSAEAALRLLAEKYRAVAFDCATTAGMAAAKAARLELREHGRYAVQRIEKAVRDEANDLKAVVGEKAAQLVAIVAPVEDAVVEQIRAQEAKIAAEKAERERQEAEKARLEAERIAKLRDGIAVIRAYVQQAAGKSAERIATGIVALEQMAFGADWQELREDADAARVETLAALRELHAATVQAEADRTAAEQLRAENARQAAELEQMRKAQAIRDATPAFAQSVAREQENPAQQEHGDARELAQGEAERAVTLAGAKAAEAAIQAATPASDGPTAPALTLEQVNARLGFDVSPALLTSFGIEPVERVRRTIYYAQAQWPSIKVGLVKHVEELA